MYPICLSILCAILSTIAFSILFSAPKKELPWCGLSGLFTWGMYTFLLTRGVSETGACLFATFLFVILARIMAIIRKVPATVYLLTGVFQLVPGAGIYYTAYYLITGHPDIAGAKCLSTFETAVAIVFGILFGSAIPQPLLFKITGKH